jgi:hypothetical protein
MAMLPGRPSLRWQVLDIAQQIFNRMVLTSWFVPLRQSTPSSPL